MLNKNNHRAALNYNFYPLKSALDYFSKKIKKFISFSGALLYDEKKLKIPCKENAPLNPKKIIIFLVNILLKNWFQDHTRQLFLL